MIFEIDTNSPYPWEQQVKVSHCNCSLVHTTRHGGYCQLTDFYDHTNLTEPSELCEIAWIESGQERITSNPGEVNGRYYKRMVWFCKYFPKNIYHVSASRIPLHSKGRVSLPWEMVHSKNLSLVLWITFWGAFPLGRVVACCEYFPKCLAKASCCVWKHPHQRVNPPPQLSAANFSPELTESSLVKAELHSAGVGLMVQPWSRRSRLAFPIAPTRMWQGWGGWDWEVPPQISHIV